MSVADSERLDAPGGVARPDRLSVVLAGMRWRNPVVVPSGIHVPWAHGMPELPLDAVGALTCKSVSLDPWSGNPKPRFHELEVGLLNSIGIANPGVDVYLRDHLAQLRALGLPLIQSLAAVSLEDFRTLAARMTAARAFAALEINMSCPNTDAAQMAFGQSPEKAWALVRAVRAETDLPVIAKLTPNGADVTAVARACAEAGASALVLINTVLAMDIDLRTGLPVTGTRTAGISGPAIRPLALRIVWDVHEVVDLPIIAAGGIASADDALRFLMAGASAVSVGTAAIKRPEVLREVAAGLERACVERDCAVADLVGLSHRLWQEHLAATEAVQQGGASGANGSAGPKS